MFLSRATRTLHLSGAGVSALAIVYVAFRHDAPMSTIQWVVLYGVPSAALVFFTVSARAEDEARAKAAMLVVSMAVALILSEAVVSLSPAPQQFEGVGDDLDSPDTRTKFQAVRDLRDRGSAAYPGMSPWALRPWADGAGERLPVTTAPSASVVVACDEGEGWLEYPTDAFGFRGDAPIPSNAAASVVFIGDSFTLGQCVSGGETIPGRVAQRWSGVRNFGVSGSGPLHQLAVLREYGPIVRPPYVVWVFYEGNDLIDLAEESRWPALTAYLEPGYRLGLPESQAPVDRWLSDELTRAFEEQEVLEASASPESDADEPIRLREVLTLTRLRAALSFGVGFPTPEPLGSLPEVLEAGVNTVSSWGGRVVFVYLPEYRRYRLLGSQFIEGKDEFMALGERLGVEVLDLTEAFESDVGGPTSLWSHPRGHLSARGYEVAATAVANFVEEHWRGVQQ